ncbi:unnamed protein product [Adineta ricciae]|uniref:Calcyclin-binding protein n=1 Tax=Adineta ricciae TaxID=249248 RepID=A0A815SLK8_ADIRI|nr:unnamed protein product [Adineta ricciae]CAF1491674.1 unnamed protein product [Adineta ricciae]
MTLDEQIQEVNDDVEELKRLINETSRSRIKQLLEVQQQKLEKELGQLKEKLQKEQQQATVQAAEKTANTLPISTHSYTKDITVYAWDQSDKFVKIYVQNLDGVGDLPKDQVECSFEKNGFHLQIQKLKNINYSLKKTHLRHDIKPEESTFRVKKDMVIVSLRKVESTNWESFLKEEKPAVLKSLPNLSKAKDNESFMNAVEEMYENGDDDTKRAIAKAWTQSREKANAFSQKQEEDSKNPDIIRTPDFTFYPPPKKN